MDRSDIAIIASMIPRVQIRENASDGYITMLDAEYELFIQEIDHRVIVKANSNFNLRVKLGYYDDTIKITMSASKTHAEIADQINRRLIPKVIEQYRAQIEKLEAAARATQELDDLLHRVENMPWTYTGYTSSLDGAYPKRIIDIRAGEISGRVFIEPDITTINLQTSTKTAMEFLEFLANNKSLTAGEKS